MVRNAQRFGFSLVEITKFLRVRDAGGKPCHDVRARAEGIRDAVDRQIKELLAVRRNMRQTLREWDGMLASTPSDRPADLLEALARKGRLPNRWLMTGDHLKRRTRRASPTQ